MQTFTRFVCHLRIVANSFRFDCFSRDGLVVYVQTESFTVPITENKFMPLKETQNIHISQQEYIGCKYQRVVKLLTWTEIKLGKKWFKNCLNRKLKSWILHRDEQCFPYTLKMT